MKIKSMKKRFLGLLLCAVMVCTFIPQGMAVASASEDDGLCEHHTEHTEDCGYSEGVEGTPCAYDCTICSEQDLDSGTPCEKHSFGAWTTSEESGFERKCAVCGKWKHRKNRILCPAWQNWKPQTILQRN